MEHKTGRDERTKKTTNALAFSFVLFGIYISFVVAIGYQYFSTRGIYFGPIPWDHIDYILGGYQNAQRLFDATTLADLLDQIPALAFHSLGHAVATVGQLLTPGYVGITIILGALTALPLILLGARSRTDAVLVLALLGLAPPVLAAIEIVKADYLGAVHMAALCLCLMRARPDDDRRWLAAYALMGFVFLTTKMTNPFNVAFYLFSMGVILLGNHLGWTLPGWRQVRHPLRFAVALWRARWPEIVAVVVVPLGLYAMLLAWRLEYFLGYILRVMGPDSVWKESRGTLQLLSDLYFKVHTDSFLPLVGPTVFGASVVLALVALAASLPAWRRHRATVVLVGLGLLYILAVAKLSPTPHPQFVSPGYLLLLLGAVGFVLDLKAHDRRAAYAVAAAFFAYGVASQSLPWRSDGVNEPAEEVAYQAFMTEVMDTVVETGASTILFSGISPELPNPNLALALARRRIPARVTAIHRPEQMEAMVAAADVIVFVENSARTRCGYVPSCRGSREIAEAIRQKLAIDTLDWHRFGTASYAIHVPSASR